MEMNRDCNQGKFGTGFYASIYPCKTGFTGLLLSRWDCNQGDQNHMRCD